MKIKANRLKESDFKPKYYQWAKLKDGSIEPLYYQDGKGNLDTSSPRNFYFESPEWDEEVEKEGWFLDHDVWFGACVAYCHSEIVEFATTEEELQQ